jgi:hypothetical protein
MAVNAAIFSLKQMPLKKFLDFCPRGRLGQRPCAGKGQGVAGTNEIEEIPLIMVIHNFNYV